MSDGPRIDPEMESDADMRERRREERGPPEADDLKQHLALRRLVNKAKLPHGIAEPDRYLARAKKHDRIDYERRRELEWSRRTVSLDDMITEPAVQPDPLDRVLDAEELTYLLAHLTDQQRDVIVKLYLLGFTRVEVASLLDLHPDTVSAIKQSAIEELRLKGRN